MLQDERFDRILVKLRKNGSVKVTDLAKELDTSESTIRRDINELHNQGMLKKVFGGAVAIKGDITFGKTDVAQRILKNVEEKDRIARYAASLVQDDDFVYIDAGTTTERMIDYLENKNATYVTNGITHAKKLIQKGYSAYMIGGLLRPSTEAVVGEDAVETVKKYYFTKCFMGTNGIDLEIGYTTPDISEAAIKRVVIKRAYRTFILADHTKFGIIAPVAFAELKEAHIITDRIDEKHYCKNTEIVEV